MCGTYIRCYELCQIIRYLAGQLRIRGFLEHAQYGQDFRNRETSARVSHEPPWGSVLSEQRVWVKVLGPADFPQLQGVMPEQALGGRNRDRDSTRQRILPVRCCPQ